MVIGRDLWEFAELLEQADPRSTPQCQQASNQCRSDCVTCNSYTSDAGPGSNHSLASESTSRCSSGLGALMESPPSTSGQQPSPRPSISARPQDAYPTCEALPADVCPSQAPAPPPEPPSPGPDAAVPASPTEVPTVNASSLPSTPNPTTTTTTSATAAGLVTVPPGATTPTANLKHATYRRQKTHGSQGHHNNTATAPADGAETPEVLVDLAGEGDLLRATAAVAAALLPSPTVPVRVLSCSRSFGRDGAAGSQSEPRLVRAAGEGCGADMGAGKASSTIPGAEGDVIEDDLTAMASAAAAAAAAAAVAKASSISVVRSSPRSYASTGKGTGSTETGDAALRPLSYPYSAGHGGGGGANASSSGAERDALGLGNTASSSAAHGGASTGPLSNSVQSLKAGAEAGGVGGDGKQAMQPVSRRRLLRAAGALQVAVHARDDLGSVVQPLGARNGGTLLPQAYSNSDVSHCGGVAAGGTDSRHATHRSANLSPHQVYASQPVTPTGVVPLASPGGAGGGPPASPGTPGMGGVVLSPGARRIGARAARSPRVGGGEAAGGGGGVGGAAALGVGGSVNRRGIAHCAVAGGVAWTGGEGLRSPAYGDRSGSFLDARSPHSASGPSAMPGVHGPTPGVVVTSGGSASAGQLGSCGYGIQAPPPPPPRRPALESLEAAIRACGAEPFWWEPQSPDGVAASIVSPHQYQLHQLRQLQQLQHLNNLHMHLQQQQQQQQQQSPDLHRQLRAVMSPGVSAPLPQPQQQLLPQASSIAAAAPLSPQPQHHFHHPPAVPMLFSAPARPTGRAGRRSATGGTSDANRVSQAAAPFTGLTSPPPLRSDTLAATSNASAWLAGGTPQDVAAAAADCGLLSPGVGLVPIQRVPSGPPAAASTVSCESGTWFALLRSTPVVGASGSRTAAAAAAQGATREAAAPLLLTSISEAVTATSGVEAAANSLRLQQQQQPWDGCGGAVQGDAAPTAPAPSESDPWALPLMQQMRQAQLQRTLQDAADKGPGTDITAAAAAGAAVLEDVLSSMGNPLPDGPSPRPLSGTNPFSQHLPQGPILVTAATGDPRLDVISAIDWSVGAAGTPHGAVMAPPLPSPHPAGGLLTATSPRPMGHNTPGGAPCGVAVCPMGPVPRTGRDSHSGGLPPGPCSADLSYTTAHTPSYPATPQHLQPQARAPPGLASSPPDEPPGAVFAPAATSIPHSAAGGGFRGQLHSLWQPSEVAAAANTHSTSSTSGSSGLAMQLGAGQMTGSSLGGGDMPSEVAAALSAARQLMPELVAAQPFGLAASQPPQQHLGVGGLAGVSGGLQSGTNQACLSSLSFLLQQHQQQLQ